MSAAQPTTISTALSFQDIIPFLLADKRIARLAWADPEVSVEMQMGTLSIRAKAEGEERYSWRPWIISDEDLRAEDWVVL